MNTNEIEIWKPIIGYELLYEVSNFGRIKYPNKSIVRRRKNSSEKTSQFRKEKFSVGYTNKKGYLNIKLQDGSSLKSVRVHRLVAIHFIPNPLNLPQVNHKDTNKKNNRVDNLEWCDNSHNIKHAYAHGLLSRKGERQNTCKIKEADVLEVREFYSQNPKALRKIYAEKLNITQTTICNIIHRKIWKHI